MAEGVESYPQLAFLLEHGCGLAQGYYLGRPMGGDDFRLLLEAGGVLNIEQPSLDSPETALNAAGTDPESNYD